MRMRMLAFIAAITGGLFLVPPAFANTLSFDFTILNGTPHSSGGFGTFTLNNNGTIAASVNYTDGGGGITGFGFNSPTYSLSETNFSTFPTSQGPWYSTLYGNALTYPPSGRFDTGWLCNGNGYPCGNITSMTWTIGNLGEFSSVFGALGGVNPSYDFFLYIGGPDNAEQWVASAVNATTPLPSTWLMLFSGFVGLGFLAYRGSKKNATAPVAA
jgi:hypothetical protein